MGFFARWMFVMLPGARHSETDAVHAAEYIFPINTDCARDAKASATFYIRNPVKLN